MRLRFDILAAGLLCAAPMILNAQDVKYPPQGEQIPGPGCGGLPDLWLEPPRPCQPSDLRDWLADITHWRNERMVRIGFDSALFST